MDGAGPFLGPLFFGDILYFEWKRRCAFFLKNLVAKRCRWVWAIWSARADRSSLKCCFVKLVVVKLQLLVKISLHVAPSHFDLSQAHHDSVARYFAGLMATLQAHFTWLPKAKDSFRSDVTSWRKRQLPDGFWVLKKSERKFWSGIVCFNGITVMRWDF